MSLPTITHTHGDFRRSGARTFDSGGGSDGRQNREADRRSSPRATARKAVWAALESLEKGDFSDLSKFACHQLTRVGLPSSDADDIVQEAIATLAIGTSSKLKGRHPRKRDLQSSDSFNRYLKGVIRSLIHTQRCLLENQHPHAPWKDEIGELIGFTDSDSGQIHNEVAFKDLLDQLFSRLRARAPARLFDILNAWRAQQFDCERIPVLGMHRRLRCELRALAAQVLHELTTETHGGAPKITG